MNNFINHTHYLTVLSITAASAILLTLLTLLFNMKNKASSSIEREKSKASSEKIVVNKDLEGKVAIVTGASDGIGEITAKELLKRGATVVYACRNSDKTEALIKKLNFSIQKNAFFMDLKLDSFTSVQKFSLEFLSKFTRLDFLINNAAVINNHKKLTEDGVEESMQVNTYSPMLLTQYFLALLHKSGGRIINVASRSHALCKVTAEDIRGTWNEAGEEFYLHDKLLYPQYFATKLGNVLFTHHLKNLIELKKLNITAVSLHPGAIKTKIMRSHSFIHYIYYYLCINRLGLNNFSLLEGAQTTLYCCSEKAEKLKNGGYYANCKEATLAPHADETQKELITEFMSFATKIVNKAGLEKGVVLNL